MLAMIIGAAFCSVPLAVLFAQFIPVRKPSQWAANDNFSPRERMPQGPVFSPFAAS